MLLDMLLIQNSTLPWRCSYKIQINFCSHIYFKNVACCCILSLCSMPVGKNFTNVKWVTSKQFVLVLQQGCLNLRNNFADNIKENCGRVDSLKSDAEPLLCEHKFIIYFQAQKRNTSTPQYCNSVLINRKKKNPRELYHNTTPATTSQKGAGERGNLGEKKKSRRASNLILHIQNNKFYVM